MAMVLTLAGSCTEWPTVWYPQPAVARSRSIAEKTGFLVGFPRLGMTGVCGLLARAKKSGLKFLRQKGRPSFIESYLPDEWRSCFPRILRRSAPRCGRCQPRPTATGRWVGWDRFSPKAECLPAPQRLRYWRDRPPHSG